MNRNILIIALVAILGGGAAFFAMSGGGAKQVEVAPQAQAEAETETVAETSDAAVSEITEMTLGNPDAPVKVVEYASFTCSHCGAFHREGFKELKANSSIQARSTLPTARYILTVLRSGRLWLRVAAGKRSSSGSRT